MIPKLFLIILTLSFPLLIQQTSIHSPMPQIISINTDFPEVGGWVQIPKGTERITFSIEAEHAETILFWLIPTGTQTWSERKLIGYDIRENESDKSFSLTWNIDKPYLHDHIYIQAIGDDKVSNEIINVAME